MRTARHGIQHKQIGATAHQKRRTAGRRKCEIHIVFRVSAIGDQLHRLDAPRHEFNELKNALPPFRGQRPSEFWTPQYCSIFSDDLARYHTRAPVDHRQQRCFRHTAGPVARRRPTMTRRRRRSIASFGVIGGQFGVDIRVRQPGGACLGLGFRDRLSQQVASLRTPQHAADVTPERGASLRVGKFRGRLGRDGNFDCHHIIHAMPPASRSSGHTRAGAYTTPATWAPLVYLAGMSQPLNRQRSRARQSPQWLRRAACTPRQS